VARRARAAVLPAPNESFVIEEYDVPEPAPGELLLRVELCGTCGSDTHIYRGEAPGIPYPIVLGHEFTGIVEQLGPGLTHDSEGKPIAVGDRVVVMPTAPCGSCYNCIVNPEPVAFCENAEFVAGFSNNNDRKLTGAWSEIVHLPRGARFFKTDLPPEIAFLTEPFSSANQGVQRANVRPGDTVLVQGSGSIGLLALATAISCGATRVIMIGGPKRRLDMARRFGADLTIDIADITDPDERVRVVREATIAGRGVDVAVEAAGVPMAVIEGIRCLRMGGHFVEIGCYADRGTIPINPNQHLLTNNITLVGAYGYGLRHFLQSLRLLERQAFPFEELLTHRLPLERARDAVMALTPERGWKIDGEEVGKIAIEPAA